MHLFIFKGVESVKTINLALDNFIKFIMASSSLVLSVVTFAQVVSRFVIKNPIAWGQDIIRLSFVYLVFWGGAYCVKEREHLNIDVLLTSVSVSSRKIIEIIINVILVLFFIFLIYFGLIFMKSGMTQNAPYLPIPMSLYYFALPSSAILMLYYQIQIIIEQIKNRKSLSSKGGEIA